MLGCPLASFARAGWPAEKTFRTLGSRMTRLVPYADGSASLVVEGLTIENGTDRVAIHGSLELTRDMPGLDSAPTLKAVLDAAVLVLGRSADLPEAVAASAPLKSVQLKPGSVTR